MFYSNPLSLKTIMIKLIKETEERKAEEIVSLEEVGLEMIKLISLSFFDDLNTTLKVFKKVNKVIFEEEEVLKKKFVMFGGSHVGIPGKEWRKQNFMLTSSGIYKLKVRKI